MSNENTTVVRGQGGNTLDIKSGATLTIESGGTLTVESGGVQNVADTGTLRVQDDGVLSLGDGDDITLSFNGTVLVITGLPTSDPSVAGALFSDSGVLTLSAG